MDVLIPDVELDEQPMRQLAGNERALLVNLLEKYSAHCKDRRASVDAAIDHPKIDAAWKAEIELADDFLLLFRAEQYLPRPLTTYESNLIVTKLQERIQRCDSGITHCRLLWAPDKMLAGWKTERDFAEELMRLFRAETHTQDGTW
jgi:hypothetical protein